MPRPTPDHSTGWWVIRIRQADGTRKKFMLAKQPGWAKGRKMPKKPPPEVELLARKYQDMDLQIRHGVDVSVVRETDLGEFLQEYQSFHATGHRPNSVLVLGQAVRNFLAWCQSQGIKTVQAVTPAVCEAYLRDRLKSVARGTVHVERCSLSPAWTRGLRGKSVAENPWSLVPTPGRADRGEPEFWTADELQRLLAAASGWVRDLILVGVNSGGRITSLLTLRWRDVHFDRGTVRLDSKTGAYEVPMSATLREVLERRRFQGKSQYVFPGRSPSVPRTRAVAYVAIRKAVRKAGLPEKGRYSHILRHTFASHAVVQGIPLIVVSKWLGHKSLHQIYRYSHLSKGESDRQMSGFSLGGPSPVPSSMPEPPDD